ncbi:MAG: phosphoribosyltransferase family protein [Deltaproteobacteria bacterium]|nr:phosphoribosyltransferase family protein [Deltaproteobacteria bacterium]
MSNNYVEKIKRFVVIKELHLLTEQDIWEIFDKSKAIILDGHFELLSKNHTDTFFRFSQISQFPYLVAKISKELVAWLKQSYEGSEIDVVLGPASQGMFFAYDIAREFNGEKGTRAVYAGINRDTGRPTGKLIEGFEIKPNENVLIVNDMTTTGSGLEILIRMAEERNAKVVGVCIFANRGLHEPKVDNIKNNYNFHSVIDLNMPYWPKEECNMKCPKGKDIIESKKINHLPIYNEEDAYTRLVQRLRLVA